MAARPDRNVALSSKVVAELREWKVKQAEELLRLGVRQTADTLICTTVAGEGIQPNSLTHEWQKAVAGTGSARIRGRSYEGCQRTPGP